MKKIVQNGDFKLISATKPSDSTSIVIDRQNYLSAVLLLSSGNATSLNTVKIKIQHGAKADGSDMVDFKPDNEIVETSVLNTADSSTNLILDLTGAKQYIKVVATTEGTAPNYSAQILLSDAQYGDNFNA